jgi:SAM-dependent methyltransferase
MSDYDATTYGERVAGIYDEMHGYLGAGEVDLLCELAGGRPALELGVGTGRLAIPLAARGVECHGIDASPAMIERLRAKPGGEQVKVSLGDFADVDVPGQFALVYVVFNTFFALLSQEEQVRCFRNVAGRLTPDGFFLIEGAVPSPSLYTGGQAFRTTDVTATGVSLHAARFDPVSQTSFGQQILIDESGIRLYPVKLRFSWPSELDLMAQLARMRLRERWGGWAREPFTARSERHVSIYERAA